MDVEINLGDLTDAKKLAERVLTAEQRLNAALEPLGEDPELARVQVIVGDMGYFDIAELGVLQAVGIRTAVADPVRNRRLDKLSDDERQVLRRAQRTTRSTSGRALMRRRGELGERSFRHVLDYGGAVRQSAKGRSNGGRPMDPAAPPVSHFADLLDQVGHRILGISEEHNRVVQVEERVVDPGEAR